MKQNELQVRNIKNKCW